MKTLKNRFDHIINFFYSVKDKNLDWQSTNQPQQLKLLHARKLAKKSLEAELAKKSVQLAHEIDLLKTHHNAELAMLKTRCKEDIKDYQDYLSALNQLKSTIQRSYAHLPGAITLTIHHHAKSLLNKMWEADDLEEKINYEAQLIKFMTTVHEEAHRFQAGSPDEKLPENTLRLINREDSHNSVNRSYAEK